MNILFICLLATLAITLNAVWRSKPSSSKVAVSYTPPSNVTNKLLSTFEKAMISFELPHSPGWDDFIPFLLRDGKVLCRRSHKVGKGSQGGRVRAYVEMLNQGLDSNGPGAGGSDGLPVIFINSDASGCDVHPNVDHVSFPRLAWSIPSPKRHGDGWCGAISVPCYATWEEFHTKSSRGHSLRWPFFGRRRSWDLTFRWNEKRYPWASKIERAVWRGSTTGGAGNGRHASNFSDMQRARLVRQSMESPDVIDAGFTAFVQDWKGREKELANHTISVPGITFNSQMKYRAIIDIDGNSWSSRFAKLLCTNSVVIKIEPDHIEYFYADLQPMVHYVPASLENITQVASHVLDVENREAMRAIVDAANSWCKRTMTREQLARDAVSQLRAYEAAVRDAYNRSSWIDEWRRVSRRIEQSVGDDIVNCDVR